MKIKKVFTLLLALALVAGLLPGTTLAAEDDGFTIVNTEQELQGELRKGTEKIRFGKDISSSNVREFEKTVVIDLDGHIWTGPSSSKESVVVHSGDVTIQNGKASFSIEMEGGSLILKGLELGGMVNCVGGKVLSIEDCTITGRDGADYPQGIYVGKNGAVGSVKDCTITAVGKKGGTGIVVIGSVDTVEGCTIITGGEDGIYGFEVHDNGTVGSIRNCNITSAGSHGCGIALGDNTVVDLIEDCAITAYIPISCNGESRVGAISGCTLKAESNCIGDQKGVSIGNIVNNVMTSTGKYGRAMEVSGEIGTFSGNIVQVQFALLQLHDGAKVEKITNNTSNAAIYNMKGAQIGVLSGNAFWFLSNAGTIDLLGRNALGRDALGRSEDPIVNEGTIQKTDTSSPVDSMDKGAWYYDAMTYAYGKNLTRGIPDDEFKPNDKLTRAMLAQMLWNSVLWNSKDLPMPGSGKFSDVDSGAWYHHSVDWAADKEIVTGDDGQFMPTDNITREQVATILYRYVQQNGGDVSGKADLSGYKDASQISAYAQEAMQWAVAENLIKGSSGALSPKGNTTCAEMATIMQRFVAE